MIQIKIKFTKCPIKPKKNYSWDKIRDAESGKEFTTFRIYGLDKHNYYSKNIYHDYKEDNTIIEIIENNSLVGTAYLLSVESVVAREITEEEIQKDTFADATREFHKRLLRWFYGRDDIALLKLTLKWIRVIKQPKLKIQNQTRFT